MDFDWLGNDYSTLHKSFFRIWRKRSIEEDLLWWKRSIVYHKMKPYSRHHLCKITSCLPHLMISSFHQNSDLFYFVPSSFQFPAITIFPSPYLQNHIMSITSYALLIPSNSDLVYFISSFFQFPAITIFPSVSLQNHIMSTTSYDLFIPSKLRLVLLHLFFF
jgi:hypothetical protein